MGREARLKAARRKQRKRSDVDKVERFHFVDVIGSRELGYSPGNLDDLDACVRGLPRRTLISVCAQWLHGLSADNTNQFRGVNDTFARWFERQGLNDEAVRRLRHALNVDGDGHSTTFLEPWQLLIVLRRAFAVSSDWNDHLEAGRGAALFFDACRFAADISTHEPVSFPSGNNGEAWLTIAASLMPRLWITTPINHVHWASRFEIMFQQLPNRNAGAKEAAELLKARLGAGVGALTFDDIHIVTHMLTAYTIAPDLRSVLLKFDDSLFIDTQQWLRESTFPEQKLKTLLDRVSLPVEESLPDDQLGGPISPLPFRDRPFLRIDGRYIAVCRELLLEKLTGDLFWWAVTPGVSQRDPWTRAYGQLFEAYILEVLECIARTSDCILRPRLGIAGEDGETDAVMRAGDHVAVVEITATQLLDAAANNGDVETLRAALLKCFVEPKGDGLSKIRQLARDVSVALDGRYGDSPAARVHPVLICADRRLQTPGVWFFLNEKLDEFIAPEVRHQVGPLAVIGLEQLEFLEALFDHDPQYSRGTSRGLLRVLELRERVPHPAYSFDDAIRQLGLQREPVRNRRLDAARAAFLERCRTHFKPEFLQASAHTENEG